MLSGPGALWGRALERVDAISSSVIEGGEDCSAGYWNSGISEKSARGIGRNKLAFGALHLASSVVAGSWGVVRERIEGSMGGKTFYDLAHFASLQNLLPHFLHKF